MLLAPGPIPPLPYDWFNATASDPGLTGLTNTELMDLPGITTSMDQLVDPAALIPEALPDDGTDGLISDASTTITGLASYDINPDMAAIDAAGQTSGDELLNVYAATPAEAWQPVPPPNDYSGPAGPANPTAGLTITLNNLTRPGQSIYQPGDTIQFVIQLPPPPGGVGAYSGVDMTFEWFFTPPGATQFTSGTVDMGRTDAQGFIHYNRAVTAADIGNWGALVFNVIPAPDGTFFEPPGGKFYWAVVASTGGGGGTGGPTPGGGGVPPPVNPPTPPGPVPLPPSTPTPPPVVATGVEAKLSNTTRPGTVDFILGDAWALQVKGAANASVIIGGTGPGGPLSPVIIGETDSTGTFNAQGYMGQSDIGTWSEIYTVGSEVARVPVNFTVYA